MSTKPTENKVAVWSASFLVAKFFFLLVVIPVLIPTTALFVQALVWRYVLCRIEGINLMGGILEAFALSMALAGFAACANLLVSLTADAVRKFKKVPQDKLAQRKAPEIATWAEMYKALPGFRSLLRHLAVNAVALFALSSLQPLRLHFDGIFELLLASGVLSACWIFCMTITSVIVYALLIKELKTKAAAGKAVV